MADLAVAKPTKLSEKQKLLQQSFVKKMKKIFEEIKKRDVLDYLIGFHMRR